MNSLRRLPHSRTSLQRHLLTWLGLTVVGAVLLIGLGVALFVYRAESDSWQNRQREAAESAAQTIAMFMQNNFETMSMVAKIPTKALVDHPQVLQEMLGRTPALLEIVRLDMRGQLTALSYQDRPVIANLFTIPQSSWFQQARDGNTYMGELQFSALNDPFIILAIPAPDGGVVAARLEMHVLHQVISGLRFGSTGKTYVVEQEGEVVAHPDPAVVERQANLADLEAFPRMLAALGHRWHGRYTNSEGEPVVGTSTAVPGTNWLIISEISGQEAFTVTRQALLVLGSVILLTGAAAMLLAVRLSRNTIFEPLARLRAGAERIGLGELGYRIPVAFQDEIGEVAEAFNRMAGQLAEREAALEQARNQAQQASQFKSRLLANVGHDLRTPINAILGYADIMNEGVYGPLNEQQQRANLRILSSSRRLQHLIDSILDQAQIEAGKLALTHEPFEPREILRGVRDALEIPAESKGVALLTACDEALPPVLLGDAQRLQQIALNLAENALKFTPRGGCVEVRLACEGPARWAIHVRDTGEGIPAEAQGYIFDAFRQVDGSTTRENKGIGLGLSIVKQLTLLMGGEVELRSRPGQGSTFIIHLPMAVGERINIV